MKHFGVFFCVLLLSTVEIPSAHGQRLREIEPGVPDPNQLVVRHPYAVNIRAGSQSLCSGVLVGDYTVVTAAQCVDPRIGREVYPTLWLNSTGSLELSEDGFVRETVEVVFHPNYTGSADDGYDIAMLKMNETASPLGPSMRTIFEGGFDLAVGRQIFTLGFGRTSLTGPSASILQIGEVEVLDPRRCIEADIGFLEDQMFCVDSVLSCSQDPGGPVFFGNNINAEVLFGLASGTRCFEHIDLSGVLDLTSAEAAAWLDATKNELDPTVPDISDERDISVPPTGASAPSAESPDMEEEDIEEQLDNLK